MRNALISALLVIFFSSIEYPNFSTSYINLRKPIYFVIEDSFLAGCEDDPAGSEACRAFRIKQINDGANDWFKHFDEATRPQTVIVYSKKNLPANPVNNPIYISVKEGYCGLNSLNHIAPACYKDQFMAPPIIVFDLEGDISSNLFSHELGHALGRGGNDHNDMPENTYSVMSYTLRPENVVPIDIKLMCETHPECPPYKNTWCQDEFWDKCRCPSDSYEDGEAMRKKYTPDCQ